MQGIVRDKVKEGPARSTAQTLEVVPDVGPVTCHLGNGGQIVKASVLRQCTHIDKVRYHAIALWWLGALFACHCLATTAGPAAGWNGVQVVECRTADGDEHDVHLSTPGSAMSR